MKRLFYILILCVLTGQLFAKCGPGQLKAWPNGSTLSQNGFIIIDGSGIYEEAVLNLGTKFPIYLKTGRTIISLNIKTTHKGQYNQSQAILTPSSALSVGLTYELVIDSLPYNKKITRQSETIQWTIIESEDSVAPIFYKKPKLKNKTYVLLGCGPVSFLTYKLNAIDSNEFKVVAIVTSKKTGKSVTYYLDHDSLTFDIGHGMCYGEFNFSEGKCYLLTIGLLDTSGNLMYYKKTMKFRRPTLLNYGQSS